MKYFLGFPAEPRPPSVRSDLFHGLGERGSPQPEPALAELEAEVPRPAGVRRLHQREATREQSLFLTLLKDYCS